MSSKKHAQKIIKIIARNCKVSSKSVTGNTELIKDLKIDSYQRLVIICIIETELKKKVDKKRLQRLQTVNDVIAYFNVEVS